MTTAAVGRFIGGPMDKVVRTLEYAYPVFYCARPQPITLYTGCSIEAPLPKRATYICLEATNELGQYLYLYAGTTK